MINNLVVGTLATLNSLVSPLGSSSPNAPLTYRFQLESNSLIASSCRNGTVMKNSELKIRFDDEKDGAVITRLTGTFCAADHHPHPIAETFSLPEEALDTDFIMELPVDRPYILPAGQQTRIKITRQRPVADLQPVVFEWVPVNAQIHPPHPPMTVWLALKDSFPGLQNRQPKNAKSAARLAELKAHANPLHWNRVSFIYSHPLTGDTVSMTGDYAGLEAEPATPKKR